MQLGIIINELKDKQSNPLRPKHISYRNSKLTFLLRDSLGGNSKTLIICNVNPDRVQFFETNSTLQFAERVKTIKNEAKVNEEVDEARYWKKKYEEEKVQNEELQREFSLKPNLTFSHLDESKEERVKLKLRF